jgi:integrase
MREKELMRAGLEMPAKQALVIDYSATWLNRRKKRRPRSTWQHEESRLRLYVLPEFGNRSIAHVKTAEWRDFFDRLMDDGGLSGATRNRVRAMMHRLYKEAIEDGVCVQNPIAAIPLLSEKKKTRPRLHWESAEDVDKYLTAMREHEAPHHYLLALILLNTGMRFGEAAGILNSDLDMRRRLIRIAHIYDRTTKTVVERTKAGVGVTRWVPMNQALYTALSARTVINPGWTVCARPDGEPASPWSFRDAHERAITGAEVKRIEVHHMRRTYATHFRNNGGSKEALKEILGHSSQIVTEGYLGEAPDFLRDQAGRVEFGVTPDRHQHPGRGKESGKRVVRKG